MFSADLTERQIAKIKHEMLMPMTAVRTDAALLFGSGTQSGFVALQALETFNELGYFPKKIIVSGGPFRPIRQDLLQNLPQELHPRINESEATYMKRILVRGGVPANSITVDEASTNTQDNVENAVSMGLVDGVRTVTFFAMKHMQKRALKTFRLRVPHAKHIGVCVIGAHAHGIEDDSWHNAGCDYTRIKIHEEAWKIGLVPHPPVAQLDGDYRDYFERGWITSIDWAREESYVHGLSEQRPQLDVKHERREIVKPRRRALG